MHEDYSAKEGAVKLGRFQRDGQTFFGAVDGDRVLAVSGSIEDGFETVGPLCTTKEVSFLPPVEPRSIVAIGINYPRRVEQHYSRSPESERYTNPVLFLLPLSSVIAHLDPIEFPRIGTRVNASGELVVVMKRRAKFVPEDKVSDHVFGFTCGNDLACPDVGRADHHQTLRAHGFDTATSIGPVIETEVSPQHLPITLSINGSVASQGSTSDMIYGVEMIVSYVTQFMTLFPGDLIFMGTPMGAQVSVGDHVEVDIGGIGTLRNRVVAAP